MFPILVLPMLLLVFHFVLPLSRHVDFQRGADVPRRVPPQSLPGGRGPESVSGGCASDVQGGIARDQDFSFRLFFRLLHGPSGLFSFRVFRFFHVRGGFLGLLGFYRFDLRWYLENRAFT